MSMQQMLMAMGGPFLFNAVIAANTNNYNLRSAAVSAGWNQITPLSATVTVNAGVLVGSTTVGGIAFSTDVTFPSGTTLNLINNGYIQGAGGAGAGGRGAGSNIGNGGINAVSGGTALSVLNAITITNNGTLAGGGGGGGGAGANNPAVTSGWTSGGGGGAGVVPGTGTANGNSYVGGTGTQTTGGAGTGSSGDGGTGGAGGAWGAAGAVGTAGNATGPTPPGAAGYYCTGNAIVTWAATGTRLGLVS